MSEFLTQPDLHALTGYARTGKQTQWLKDHGLPHRVDGARVIVASKHVTDWLEGRTVVTPGEFNWGSVK
jgi:Domain of unknown function (DUF4224)